MPNTPSINFNFENRNVQASVPLLGVSHVLARTTKGQFNKPDEIIGSWNKFQEIYGDEIVPDGSISNIKKAFELGSKLRISRVAGSGEVSQGTGKVINLFDDSPSADGAYTFQIILNNPDDTTQTYTIGINIKTKEAGSAIVDNTGYGLNRNFYLKLYKASSPSNKYYLQQFTAYNKSGEDSSTVINIPTENILANNLIFSSAGEGQTPFIEPSVFQDFVNNAPNLELSVNLEGSTTNSSGTGIDSTDTMLSKLKEQGINGVINYLISCQNWNGYIVAPFYTYETDSWEKHTNDKLGDTPSYVIINEGKNGGDSDVSTWVDAYNAIRGYNDGYQLILSHVHQHIKNDYTEAYKQIADDVKAKFEIVLYVEVPKYKAGTFEAQQQPEIVSSLKTLIPTVGQAKNICYYAGGIKYYDANGSLQNCDVLGSVIGLGDSSASNYGPYRSFSGMNRGIIPDALGPVTDNLGGPGMIEELQELAEWYCNLFVIKDTSTQGKRTMLWHGFTSNPKSDSEKFLSIVRLNLYIKKNLRPILERYIEEPNNWVTWKNIYLEGRVIMDDLVDNQAITSYEWIGDQYATSYDDLQVNNEADVRQGKYHLVLKYKDIVPLQEITVDIIIDSATQDISINTENL